MIKTKEELLRVPGSLKMTASVMTHKEAESIALKRDYVAWFWDKRAKRLYGKVSASKNVEGK
jgi:hypothetical protein